MNRVVTYYSVFLSFSDFTRCIPACFLVVFLITIGWSSYIKLLLLYLLVFVLSPDAVILQVLACYFIVSIWANNYFRIVSALNQL